ncbi:MAG: 6-bladed beta-propeller, partial [Gemmatimonadales bacterium]
MLMTSAVSRTPGLLRLALPLSVLALLGIAGCGDSDSTEASPDLPEGQVRDSAGVSILEFPASDGRMAGPQWDVDADLRIGVESGDPELEFGQIAGITVHPDGRIIVLDAQASRIRVFSPEGELVHAFGRAGQGPGELSLGAAGLFMDSEEALLVPDMMNQRLSRFSLDGESLGSTPLDFTLGIPLLWMAEPDGRVLFQLRTLDMMAMTTGGGPGDVEDLILARHPDGSGLDTLAVMPSGETFGMGSSGIPEIRFFAPELVWTVLDGGTLVTSTNDRFSLEFRSEDGELRRIVRRPGSGPEVTEGQRRAFRDAIMDAWSEAGVPDEMMGMMSEAIGFHSHWPTLAALFPGPDGTVWIQSVDPERVLGEADQLDFTDPAALTF